HALPAPHPFPTRRASDLDEIRLATVELDLLRAERNARFAAVLAFVARDFRTELVAVREERIRLEREELRPRVAVEAQCRFVHGEDRKSTRLNSSHVKSSY